MKLNARIVWHLEDPIKELVVTDIELSSNDPGELYLQIIILAANSQTTTNSFPKGWEVEPNFPSLRFGIFFSWICVLYSAKILICIPYSAME